jgi:hypothetical protein
MHNTQKFDIKFAANSRRCQKCISVVLIYDFNLSKVGYIEKKSLKRKKGKG